MAMKRADEVVDRNRRQRDKRHVGHERERQGEVHRIERESERAQQARSPAECQLAQREVERPASQHGEDDRRQTKNAE